MEPYLREHPALQFMVLAALGLLILISVWRPVVGLTLSAVAMVLMAYRIYYDAGPTSTQVTTAAIYMAAGLLAAGFAGYIRLLERPGTAPMTPPEQDDEWEWIDGPEGGKAPK